MFLPAVSRKQTTLMPLNDNSKNTWQHRCCLLDIWHIWLPCVSGSFPRDSFPLLGQSLGFLKQNAIVLSLGLSLPENPPLLRSLWRHLEAFLMETFTQPGKLPGPQDSAKPLTMIESVSALCWKHAESLTLECAARLVQGDQRGGIRRGREGKYLLGVGGFQ